MASIVPSAAAANADITPHNVFDDDATLLDHTALIDELQELLGVPVDVVSAGAVRERDEAIRAEALPK